MNLIKYAKRSVRGGSIALSLVWLSTLAQVQAVVPDSSFKLTEIKVQNGNVIVRWQAPTNAGPYQVQSKTSLNGAWQNVDEPTTGTSMTSVMTDPQAFYRVSDVGASLAAAAARNQDPAAPTVPASLTAVAANCGLVNLSWSQSIDPTNKVQGRNVSSGVNSYNVYRSGVFLKKVTASANTTISTSDSSVAALASYSYSVSAIDNAGNQSAQSALSSVTIPVCSAPTVPGGLTASPASCSQMNVSWNASTDTGGSGLKGYNVYRYGVFLKQVLAPSTSTADTGLSASSTYSYRVSAVDNANNESAQSGSVANSTPACSDTTAPTVGLTVSGGTSVSGTVSLDSTAIDNVGVGRVEFYRDGVIFATDTAAAYSTSFDTRSVANGLHTFMAKAYDGANNSSTASVTRTVDNSSTGTPGQLQWVRPITGGEANVLSVKTDSAGNTIVAGNFRGTVDFGGGPVSGQSGLVTDIFIAKYSPGSLGVPGTLLWLKTFGSVTSAGGNSGNSLFLTSTGEIVVTGYFSSSVDFGGTVLTSIGGGMDIFLAKYSPSGGLVWAKSFGGVGTDMGQAVAVDTRIDPGTGQPYNTILLAAAFQVSIDFGVSPLISAGANEMALAKFSPTGVAIWSKRYGSTGSEWPYGVAVDGAGDMLVTGDVQGTVDVGSGTMTAGGFFTIFLAKYSGANGSHLWSRIIGNAGANHGYGVTLDPTTGNAIFTGGFYGTVDFGGGPITTMTGGGIFLAAYGSSGNYIWAKAYGSYGMYGAAVSIDGSGNLAFTGRALGSIDWEGLGGYVAGSGYYVASCTVSGNSSPAFRWATWSPQGGGDGTGQGIAFDTSGHIMTGGWFRGTTDFGGTSVTGSPSINSAFVAQYNK